MNSPVLDKLMASIDLETNLLPYLKLSGWDQIDQSNGHWIVMSGAANINGNPLEIVFPKDRQRVEERQAYIQKAVGLLTAIKRDEPLQLLLQRIINFDRDLLYVRNTEVEGDSSISFKLAVDQVTNLKKVIEYAALSERDTKPYFRSVSQWARNIMSSFRFGHTFAGSFGFSVEAPQLPAPPKDWQYPLPIEDDIAASRVDVPIERRIVERIARGLDLTKQAEQNKDHSVLLKEYASGFNSNMCSAVVGMSREMSAKVEFRIDWSPKIQPGEDLADIKPIQLRKNGYEMLTFVGKELKSVKPDVISVIGHIRALTSSDNPHSLGTRRAVIIRAVLPGMKRAADVIVELERDDYSLAIKIHDGWQNVQVKGILSRSGTGWRLLNYQDFRVCQD